jgi:hypothetical protein
MEERLNELRDEYRRGVEEMARLEHRRVELSRALLRISGAIQVLEELLGERPAGSRDAPPAGPRMHVAGD